MPTSAVSSPPVPLESYRLHQEEISLLMSHFFVGCLRDIYTQFEGDLALVIVLGETAHLETFGWVERAGRREVRITAAVARHFQPDFNFNLLSNLLTTAERIRAVLQSPPEPTPS